MATIICFPAFKHKTPCAFCLVFDSTGSRSAAKMLTTAITTNNSTRVKALGLTLRQPVSRKGTTHARFIYFFFSSPVPRTLNNGMEEFYRKHQRIFAGRLLTLLLLDAKPLPPPV